MEAIFFSVIIPTYNQANLLTKAIRSVLNQSFKNFEIIVSYTKLKNSHAMA